MRATGLATRPSRVGEARVASVQVRLFAAARDGGRARRRHARRGDARRRARPHPATYGPAFAAVLDTARVWVNGDEPEQGDATVLVGRRRGGGAAPVSGG
jgi:hypothetical protein